jgi:hypothetical protein
MTNGYLCSYTTSGTLLSCNTNPATFAAANPLATDSLWDAAGDLVQGTGANTAARIPLGTQNTFCRAGSGTIEYSPYTMPATVCTTGYPLLSDGTNIVCGAAAQKTATTTASKPTCTDATNNFVDCAGTEGIWAAVAQTMYIGTTQVAINRASNALTLAGITLTSPVINTPAITTAEVDGHTDQTALTAAQVSNTVIYNTGQGGADVFLLLPTAAAGYSFLATVGTAQAFHFGVEAGASDKIYLIAADGTVAAGDNNAAVVMTAAQIGQSFACWTFKTDAYDWMCKAISIGTSTFAAHAHSTP